MTWTLPPAGRPREVTARLDLVIEVLEDLLDLDEHWSTQVKGIGESLKELKGLRSRYGEPFRLAVVGEFNAGKSRLINALLGLQDALPEDAVATTGAVTELWKGDGTGDVLGPEGQVIYSGSARAAREYADQNTAEGRGVSGRGVRIRLFVEADILDNLVIVDTPGLGAHDADDRVTFESLSIADAALLVVNGTRPGGEESLRLAERLRMSGRRLIPVLTRKDQTDREQREKVSQNVWDTFAGTVSARPIWVDSINVWKGLSAGDGDGEAAKAALEESGYAELRAGLDETFVLGEAVESRQASTLGSLRTVLGALRHAAADESERFRARTEEANSGISELDHELRHVMANKKHALRQEVAGAVDDEVDQLFTALGSAVDHVIEDLADGRRFLGLRTLVGKVNTRARESVERQVHEEFENVFPASSFEEATSRISARLAPAMELTWSEAVGELSVKAPEAAVPDWAFAKVLDRVGTGTVSGVAQIGGSVLLFIPGGILIDAALLVFTGGIRRVQGQRLPGRVLRIQQMARTRLRTEKQTFRSRLEIDFQRLNDEIAEAIMQPVRERRAERTSRKNELLRLAERWAEAAGRLERLTREDH